MERRVLEQFEVRGPWFILRCCCWSVLYPDGYSERESYNQLDRSMYNDNVSLAINILAVPIHASHEILFNVRILASINVQIAATAVKTALQVPCVDTAFRAIDVLIIPDPATMIHAAYISLASIWMDRSRTDNKGSVQDLLADPPHHHMPSVIHTINGRVIDLEMLNLHTGPCRDECDCDQADNSRNQTQRVKHGRDRKDSKTHHSLDHDDTGHDPTSLPSVFSLLVVASDNTHRTEIRSITIKFSENSICLYNRRDWFGLFFPRRSPKLGLGRRI